MIIAATSLDPVYQEQKGRGLVTRGLGSLGPRASSARGSLKKLGQSRWADSGEK